ncbi:hypothetical protein VNO77_50775 [Canavalia gladiata]|uniref:Uncharacterized protein n=1 Tax=Canavalia gladiata TaxID=3824 RepID=A0AAN9PF34_CANGL
MSISPSLSPRQCPDRYAFRAGRNLPDKEFRYLRTVIVTAAVHRGFGRRLPCHQVTNFLDLPALGRRQPPYMVLRLCGDLCFCLLRPSGPTRGSTGIFTCCPSTTPFGLILGPDSPSVDEPCGGTLRFSRHWILTNVCVTQADILASASSTTARAVFRVCLDLVPLSRPAPKQCFTPRCPVNCCASTHFGENQLALGSSGISPLTTTHPLILQHQSVRTST